MISIDNVSFTYSDGTMALCGVSLEIPSENIFAVLGDSGSGKTTLLNCIARFLIPQNGDILLDGRNIYDMDEPEFRKKIGVVFQNLHLFPHLTILENMTLAPCKVKGMGQDGADSTARDMLERFGMPELGDSYPSQVSGGQAQRAAIARGLMLEPEYMLLDEPTSALDARTTDDFAAWLRELKANTTFVIVTHDLPFAAQVTNNGIYMDGCHITHTGSIGDIIATIKQGA